MTRLTEEMIIARSRVSDVSSIKRLNFWGGDLTDVSILRRMQNLEVLALSLNRVSSFYDFQNLHSLKELYVRKNQISNLNQICYLQNLPLKVLWLAENPCANEPLYRLTVLKMFPLLTKLDDEVVQPEEVEDAQWKGRELIHPEDESALESEPLQKQRISPQRSLQPVEYSDNDRCVQPVRPSRPSPDYEVQRVPTSYQPEPEDDDVRTIPQYQARRPSDLSYQSSNIATVAESANGVNGKTWSTATTARADSPSAETYIVTNNSHFSATTSPTGDERRPRNDRRGSSASSNGSNRSRSNTESPPGRQIAPAAQEEHAPGYNYSREGRTYQQPQDDAYVNGNGYDRRWVEPPKRTATATNLLTAVLCLLMELDYEELVQVERTVRRRKQEMVQHHPHSP